MAVKFFGQFLLEKNIITPQQLMEAIEYQESKNLRFGDYALLKGYLTEKDIERIQYEQKRIDMSFGELAMQLKLLNPAQVQEILTMQSNHHIFIGEILFRKGFVPPDVLQRELALFKEEQKTYASDAIYIPPGVVHPDDVKAMVVLTQKMLQRFTHLNVKVEDGFVSSHEPAENSLLVSVFIHGGVNFKYAFSTSREIAEIIASSIIGEDVKGADRETICDGVKEFCNIVCGNIIVKLAQTGKSADINPPEEIPFSSDGYHLVGEGKAVFYPLVSPEGESILIIVHYA